MTIGSFDEYSKQMNELFYQSMKRCFFAARGQLSPPEMRSPLQSSPKQDGPEAEEGEEIKVQDQYGGEAQAEGDSEHSPRDRIFDVKADEPESEQKFEFAKRVNNNVKINSKLDRRNEGGKPPINDNHSHTQFLVKSEIFDGQKSVGGVNNLLNKRLHGQVNSLRALDKGHNAYSGALPQPMSGAIQTVKQLPGHLINDAEPI